MTVLKVLELDLEGAQDYYSSLEEGDVGLRTFLVITDDPTHTPPQIKVANDGSTAIPAPLSGFPGSAIALCTKIHPSRNRKDRTKWLVTCDYKSILNNQELQQASNPDPLSRVTAISGTSRTVMMPMRRLLRTAPYKLWSEAGPGATWGIKLAVNSATDPIDPPIDVACTEWQIHCEKNVSSFPSWFLTYSNGVNLAAQNVTILGTTVTLPKGCAKLGNFSFSEERKENGTLFIRIAWDVICLAPRDLFSTETDHFSPWDEERLDEGMRQYNTSLGKWTNIRDSSNQSVSLPVPLNGDGDPINVTGAKISQTDLWYSAYRPYGDRVDYSVIPWT